MNINELDTVVFAGGGTRGLAYVGTLMAFQDVYHKTIGSHFKTFVGTSVGALFALVCLLDIDVTAALDVFESIGLEKIFDRDVTWLLTNFALNNGETLRGLILQFLSMKGLTSQCTFQDLFAKFNKTFVVTVVDLVTSSVLYLDHTNEGHDMPIVKAVMGSMALPPVFPPVAHTFGTSTSILMSDGGLLDNFPVARFERHKTLGIRTTWYLDPTNPSNDISAYYVRVLSILQLTMHVMQSTVASEYPNVVCIDLGPVKANEIHVDTKTIILHGYRSAIVRFSSKESLLTILDLPQKYFVDNPSRETLQWLPTYLVKLRALIQSKTNL